MHNIEKISKEIAQNFNVHFINIGSDLAKSIKPNILPLPYINATMNSLSIPHPSSLKER